MARQTTKATVTARAAKKETTTSTTKGTKATKDATTKTKTTAAAGATGKTGSAKAAKTTTPDAVSPDLGAALGAQSDRTLIRAHHHSRRYAVLEVTAPAATETAVRPTVNVAFVLDRSGSMSGGRKFAIAVRAIQDGIARLAKDDRFAIVVFDTAIDVLAPMAHATPTAKDAALRALARVGPRGGTHLAGGWLHGAEQVAAALDADGVNRVLLLTDGHANHGITDTPTLAAQAAGLRSRGIATSTFGVGEDHDEGLLGAMADSGGGTFRYIARPEQIAPAIAQEVGELLEVTARGATVRFTTPAGIHIETLSPFPIDRRSGSTTVALGDMVADQIVRLVVSIDFPMGEIGTEIGVAIDVADRSGPLVAGTTLTWTFADNRMNDHQQRDRTVDRIVARTYADQALRDVVDLNRHHRWDDAERLLHGVAARIAGYAGDDAELQAIVAELRYEAPRWAMDRFEGDRKLAYASRTSSLKHRRVIDDGEPFEPTRRTR